MIMVRNTADMQCELALCLSHSLDSYTELLNV